jgi:hypothetical protein
MQLLRPEVQSSSRTLRLGTFRSTRAQAAIGPGKPDRDHLIPPTITTGLPARTGFALWTDGPVLFPINPTVSDGKARRLLLLPAPIALHRSDPLNPVLPLAVEQLTRFDVAAVDQRLARQQFRLILMRIQGDIRNPGEPRQGGNPYRIGFQG